VDARGACAISSRSKASPRGARVALDLAQHFDERRGDPALRHARRTHGARCYSNRPRTLQLPDHGAVARRGVLNFDASTSSTSKGGAARDTLRRSKRWGVRPSCATRTMAPSLRSPPARPGAALIIPVTAHRASHAGVLGILPARQAGADFSQLKVAIVGDVKHASHTDLRCTLGAARDPRGGPFR
jgi:aspartate carbamoyltransferase catalytic subunit